jgi:hypothetical protein
LHEDRQLALLSHCEQHFVGLELQGHVVSLFISLLFMQGGGTEQARRGSSGSWLGNPRTPCRGRCDEDQFLERPLTAL